jgi:hypothetical protein
VADLEKGSRPVERFKPPDQHGVVIWEGEKGYPLRVSPRCLQLPYEHIFTIASARLPPMAQTCHHSAIRPLDSNRGHHMAPAIKPEQKGLGYWVASAAMRMLVDCDPKKCDRSLL